MASARVAFLAVSMVLLSSVAMATDYIVGDDKGWALDFNYSQWAQDKVFRVGDSLGKYRSFLFLFLFSGIKLFVSDLLFGQDIISCNCLICTVANQSIIS